MAEGSRVGEVKLTRVAGDSADAPLAWVEPDALSTLAARSRAAGALAVDVDELDGLRQAGPVLMPVSPTMSFTGRPVGGVLGPVLAAVALMALALSAAGVGTVVTFASLLAAFVSFALAGVFAVGSVIAAAAGARAWSRNANAQRRWSAILEKARIRRRHPTLGPARLAVDDARRRLASSDAPAPMERDLAEALLDAERALNDLERAPPDVAAAESAALLAAAQEVGRFQIADAPVSPPKVAERVRASVRHAQSAFRERS